MLSKRALCIAFHLLKSVRTAGCTMDSSCRSLSGAEKAIVRKMYEADAICFATPIYYYEMSGQMKTLLDRANPLYTMDYHFRDIYFLSSAAEDDVEAPSRAITGLGGWIACFEHTHLAGTVFAGGVTGMGEIEGHPSLKSAYLLGKSVR